jgi:hypothetical protein
MRLADLDAAFEKAFAAKQFAEAEAAMRQLTELQPGNIAMRYNLALTIAAQSTAANDRDAEAATLIVRAIDDGFSDARRILRDPMLERVREHAQLRAMLQDWAKVQETQREALLAAAQQEFPSCTHRVTLEELRIELITHLPQDEAGLIAGELAKVHEFVTRHALPSNEQLGIDRLIERDSATNPNAAALWSDPWSIIIIPDAQDYKGWTNRMFGGANPNLGAAGAIGGLYDHASKRLVAIDAGSTLRHEFAHVLHQRLCERVGQTHPVWMLEGLATLVEDMDPRANDEFFPAASWRSNSAFRMAGTRVLPTAKSLSAMPPQVFGGPRALMHYAAVRNIFFFAHEKGLLSEWFENYMKSRETGIAHDPSGFASLLAVAKAAPLQEMVTSEQDLEKAIRSFARSQKSVPEETLPGSPSMGVVVESTQGVGLVVVDVPARLPTTLRRGDVIIKVGAHSVRDIAELLRVLPLTTQGLLDLPDARISVIVRRGGELVSLEVPVRRAK